MVRALVQSHTVEPELKHGSNFLHIFSQERDFCAQVSRHLQVLSDPFSVSAIAINANLFKW